MFFIISLIVFIFSTGLTGILCKSALTVSQKSHEAISAKQATHSKVTTRWGGFAILLSVTLFVLYDQNSISVFIMMLTIYTKHILYIVNQLIKISNINK